MPDQKDSKQSWNADQYADNARFVSDLGAPVLDLLLPVEGMRILDLGCGDGALTEKIIAAGAEVLAIDHSPSQIEAARHRGLDAHVRDALEMSFEREFDAVFSNAVLHWIKPPEVVVANVARALKPGGRFVGEFGGHGNVEAIRSAALRALSGRGIDGLAVDPWFFPTPDEYRALLTSEGFDVQSVELIPRPTPLPGSMAAWIETLAQDFIAPVPEEERADFLAGVEEDLKPHLQKEDGSWFADYVRLRFAAALEPSS